MQIKEALIKGQKELAKCKITSARLDAEVLLSLATKKPKESLYAHPEALLSRQQKQAFLLLIKKRQLHCPVAYLVGQKEFFGLEFFVNKNVLLPRPESELIIEETLSIIKTIPQRKKIIIADIGTGSGCLAIALAKNCSVKINIFATDIFKKALVLAKKNCHWHNVSSKINFLQGDLLNPIKNKSVDIIIANLPYLRKQNLEKTSQPDIESLAYEPQSALYADERDGLSLYKKLFKQVNILKNKPRFILIEINPEQTNFVKLIIKKFLPDSRIKIIRDLAGLNRIVKISI